MKRIPLHNSNLTFLRNLQLNFPDLNLLGRYQVPRSPPKNKKTQFKNDNFNSTGPVFVCVIFGYVMYSGMTTVWRVCASSKLDRLKRNPLEGKGSTARWSVRETLWPRSHDTMPSEVVLATIRVGYWKNKRGISIHEMR